MHPKPVKVMDAYICGMCRVGEAPRLTVITQWDLRGIELDFGECACQWDGEKMRYCNECSMLQ